MKCQPSFYLASQFAFQFAPPYMSNGLYAFRLFINPFIYSSFALFFFHKGNFFLEDEVLLTTQEADGLDVLEASQFPISKPALQMLVCFHLVSVGFLPGWGWRRKPLRFSQNTNQTSISLSNFKRGGRLVCCVHDLNFLMSLGAILR